MASGHNGDASVPAASLAPSRLEPHIAGWLCRIGWLFPRNTASDAVATSVQFHATPELVWQRMLMYEEVSARPPLLLRLLLPHPVRTEGDKTRAGAAVRCTYTGGHLVKLIKVVRPPHLVQFEIIEQRLGIEGCITTLGGSYELQSRGDETQIVLTTRYLGHLRPRFLWRPLERLLARQLHRHILEGMRAALHHSGSPARPAIAEHSMMNSIPP